MINYSKIGKQENFGNFSIPANKTLQDPDAFKFRHQYMHRPAHPIRYQVQTQPILTPTQDPVPHKIGQNKHEVSNTYSFERTRQILIFEHFVGLPPRNIVATGGSVTSLHLHPPQLKTSIPPNVGFYQLVHIGRFSGVPPRRIHFFNHNAVHQKTSHLYSLVVWQQKIQGIMCCQTFIPFVVHDGVDFPVKVLRKEWSFARVRIQNRIRGVFVHIHIGKSICKKWFQIMLEL